MISIRSAALHASASNRSHYSTSEATHESRDFRFDPDLASATTIPADWYTEVPALGLERERIFGRTWQFVSRIEQVRQPDDFFTCSVVDEPLVVTRAGDGQLHAFFNVCRHRTDPVAQGVGNCKSWQCLYRGWIYSLDGQIQTTPEFDGVRSAKAMNLYPGCRRRIWADDDVLCWAAHNGQPPRWTTLGAIPHEWSRSASSSQADTVSCECQVTACVHRRKQAAAIWTPL